MYIFTLQKQPKLKVKISDSQLTKTFDKIQTDIVHKKHFTMSGGVSVHIDINSFFGTMVLLSVERRVF